MDRRDSTIRIHHGRAREAIRLLMLVFALWDAEPSSAQDRYELAGGQWLKQHTHSPESPEGQIQAIRKKIAENHPKTAQKLAKQWIEKYPNHPLLVEAYLLHGDALVARRHYYKALFDYEHVIMHYPASEQFHTALEREFEIARLFTQGMNRRFWGMRWISADGEGEELLIRTQERAPGSEIGHRASLTLADYYYDKSKMSLAAEAYDLFLINYPKSNHREWVMLRLVQASLARFKGPEFDPTGLIDAAQRLKAYRQEYPAAAERSGTDARLVRIDESLALKELVTAKWFETREQHVSAMYLYQRLVAAYPQTGAAEQGIQRIQRLEAKIAKAAEEVAKP